MSFAHIVTVLGARPQFIKASIVSHTIDHTLNVKETIVHTGQHYDTKMSDVFFVELGMRPPAYNLDVGGGSHGNMTGLMLIRIEELLMKEQPDAVLVYGDTNSTLAGALAAAKLHIPVAHVEAGVRSFNLRMPEEINRVLTDKLSHWLFAPTSIAVNQLIKEGMPESSISLVGDVMLDAALLYGARAKRDILDSLGLSENNYVLCTVHRAENTDKRHNLSVIVEGLIRAANNVTVVWPLHPRTRKLLDTYGLLEAAESNLECIEPASYLEMVALEKHAAVIATDSGGVQKEAFFHRVPCVTLREETEWPELLSARWNRLAPPTSPDSISNSIESAIGSVGTFVEPYGNGAAAKTIVDMLARDIGRGTK